MVSSRRIATNENISTYGGATRDYTALATWEAATDIDLVSATQSEVLECYDDVASFDDAIAMEDAICNSSYFRIMRPASGEGHDGTSNNGFTIINTTDVGALGIAETYSQIQDIICKSSINSSANRVVFYSNGLNSAIIGCICFDSVNSGTGSILYAFSFSNPGVGYIINCLADNSEKDGFRIVHITGPVRFYSCTSVNNGRYGFINEDNSTSIVVKNCCSSGNSTADWGDLGGGWTKSTCTAEGANPTYVNVGGNDFHLAEGDTVCKGNGTNLSSDSGYAFDDDIDGDTRSVWDISFDEFQYGWTGKISGVTNPAKINGVAVANITKVMGQ